MAVMDEEQEPVPANERRVRQGGLMRCCLETIAQCTDPTKVRDTLDCKYEAPGNKNMIVGDDGIWLWNNQ